MNPKSYLKQLFLKGLEECSPQSVVKGALEIEDNHLRIGENAFDLSEQPLFVFGVGKASVPMFEAVYDRLSDHISRSLVITSDSKQLKLCSADETIEGAHPTPDERSLKAGKKADFFFVIFPNTGC